MLNNNERWQIFGQTQFDIKKTYQMRFPGEASIFPNKYLKGVGVCLLTPLSLTVRQWQSV